MVAVVATAMVAAAVEVTLCLSFNLSIYTKSISIHYSSQLSFFLNGGEDGSPSASTPSSTPSSSTVTVGPTGITDSIGGGGSGSNSGGNSGGGSPGDYPDVGNTSSYFSPSTYQYICNLHICIFFIFSFIYLCTVLSILLRWRCH